MPTSYGYDEECDRFVIELSYVGQHKGEFLEGSERTWDELRIDELTGDHGGRSPPCGVTGTVSEPETVGAFILSSHTNP